MMLVERDRELDRLLALLGDCAAGRGRTVLINGAGASGKTTLLRIFVEDVAQAGGMALSATCSRAEKLEPYGVVGQLLRSATLPEDVTDRIEELLGAAAADPVKGSDFGQIRGLVEIVVGLARTRPVVLVIDDIEFLDDETKSFLSYLQRRISTARVMIALTESVQLGSTDPLFLAELTRQPHFTKVVLPPLTRSGTRQLVVSHLGEGAGDLTAEFHRLSGGNPLLVKALVDDNRPAHGGAGPTNQLAVGDAYRQAVLSCLHRWEPTLLACARGVAVLDDHADHLLLRQVLDDPAVSGSDVKVTAASLTRALAALNLSGLMAANRFLHRAAEQAVLGDIPPETAAALHARAAAELYAVGAPATDIAGHLLATDETPGEWAVPLLRAAADQALADNRVSHAVDCLDLARRACTSVATRAAITARLAAVQWQMNPSAAARHLVTLKAAVHAGHVGDREAATLIRHLLWQGQAEEAEDLLGWLEKSADEPDGQDTDEIGAIPHWLRSFHPPLYHRVRGPTGRGKPGAGAPGGSRLSAVLGTAFSTAPTDESTRWAEQLLQSCRLLDTPLESVIAALYTLIHADQIEQATQWCDAIRADAVSGDAATWAAALADIRSYIALRQGDLRKAEHFARVALATLSPHNWGVALGSPLSNLVLATTAMGDAEQAEKALRCAIPDTMRSTLFWPVYLRARGTYHMRCTQRLHAALEDFETCGSLLAAWGIDHPALLPWRSDAAQVLVRMGKPDRAKDLLRAQLTGPGSSSARVRGMSLRVLASTADITRRIPILRESVDLLQESGDLLELSFALANLSNAYSALSEFSRARLIARRAIQTAKSCHAEAICQQLLPRTAVIPGADESKPGGDTDVIAALSEAERRVAALAAAGLTNREISRKLFITVSTVEQHLTRVYRKLNVNRRTDLPGELRLSRERLLIAAPRRASGESYGHP